MKISTEKFNIRTAFKVPNQTNLYHHFIYCQNSDIRKGSIAMT